jgi:CHAT domain-containing protein
MQLHVPFDVRFGVPGLVALQLLLTLAFLAVAASQPEDDSEAAGKALLVKGLAFLQAEQYDSAYAYCEQAKTHLKQGRDSEAYLASVNAVAETYMMKGKVYLAETIVRDGLSLTDGKVPQPSATLAKSYSIVAYSMSYRDQADSAIIFSERSLAIRREIFGRNDPRLASNYYTLGLSHKKKGLYQEAVSDCREAIRLDSLAGTATTSTANTLLLLGNLMRERGEYNEATQSLGQAIAILRTLGLRRSHSMVVGMLYEAICCAERGHFSQAIALYDSCTQLAYEVYPDNHAVIVAIGTGKGMAFAASGDLDRALDAYLDALRRTETLMQGTASSIGEIHQYIAATFLEKGDLDSALQHAQRAFDLKVEALGRDHPDLAASHEMLADVRREMKDYASALYHLGEALRIQSLLSAGSRRPAGLMLKQAKLDLKMGDEKSAEASVRQAFISEREASPGNPIVLSSAYETLADIEAKRGAVQIALSSIDSAMAALYPEISGPIVTIEALPEDLARGKHLLRLLRKRGELLEGMADGSPSEISDQEAALSSCVLATQTLSKLRRGYETEGSKVRILEEFEDTVERGIRLALKLWQRSRDQKYVATAFELAEGSKAGLLLEGIQAARVRQFAGIPDTLLAKERAIRVHLTALDLQLAKSLEQTAYDTARIAGLRQSITSLREELWQTRESLRRAYPRYAGLIAADGAPDVARIQQSLGDSTLLVEYYLGKEEGFVFTLGKDRLEGMSLGPCGMIGRETDGLLQAIRTFQKEEFVDAAGKVYAYVLRPIQTQLNKYARVIVVPDRCLWQIPYEVLWPASADRAGRATSFSTVPFLIKSHEVEYTLSARVFWETRQASGTDRQGLVTFAGFAPVFRDKGEKRVNVVSSRLASRLDTTDLRSITVDGKKLRELPFSEEEVKSIAGEFSKHGRNVSLFLNAEATKEAFSTTARSCSYLHVATHGLVNRSDPRRSALIFAQNSGSQDQLDGALFAAEAYNLALNADLVVLSSCESGVGSYVTGEGMYTLTRGFLYSGARNVTYSLWKVKDHHTSELMRHFYRGILDGSRPGKALQQAKITMLSQPETSFPFSWAGFVLIGE